MDERQYERSSAVGTSFRDRVPAVASRAEICLVTLNCEENNLIKATSSGAYHRTNIVLLCHARYDPSFRC